MPGRGSGQAESVEPVEAIRTGHLAAKLHGIPESDHFFSFRAERIAVLVAAEASPRQVETQ